MSGKAIVRGLLTGMTICCAVVAQADVFNIGTGLTSLETLRVGNPGNSNDSTGYGAVGYNYQIGKFEVTNAQYCEFLNNKAATDPYGLYNTKMTQANSLSETGGINRSGSSGSYKYSVKSGYENMPVTYVCWYDCIRFANWLQNGQSSGSTESGTYAITNGGFNSGNVAIPDAGTRATWSATHWVLPSENEWYKAAYYQPASQGGDADNYWAYPTGTNSAPYSAPPPGSNAPVQANTANFCKWDGVINGYDDGYAVIGSPDVFSTMSHNNFTNVGAYTMSASFYGTFDQGGNAWEWNEVDYSGNGWSRGVRGGAWGDTSDQLDSSFRIGAYPATSEEFYIGFRVASVPEPGSLVMLVGVALTALLYWRRKRV